MKWTRKRAGVWECEAGMVVHAYDEDDASRYWEAFVYRKCDVRGLGAWWGLCEAKKAVESEVSVDGISAQTEKSERTGFAES